MDGGQATKRGACTSREEAAAHAAVGAMFAPMAAYALVAVLTLALLAADVAAGPSPRPRFPDWLYCIAPLAPFTVATLAVAAMATRPVPKEFRALTAVTHAPLVLVVAICYLAGTAIRHTWVLAAYAATYYLLGILAALAVVGLAATERELPGRPGAASGEEPRASGATTDGPSRLWPLTCATVISTLVAAGLVVSKSFAHHWLAVIVASAVAIGTGTVWVLGLKPVRTVAASDATSEATPDADTTVAQSQVTDGRVAAALAGIAGVLVVALATRISGDSFLSRVLLVAALALGGALPALATTTFVRRRWQNPLLASIAGVLAGLDVLWPVHASTIQSTATVCSIAISASLMGHLLAHPDYPDRLNGLWAIEALATSHNSGFIDSTWPTENWAFDGGNCTSTRCSYGFASSGDVHLTVTSRRPDEGVVVFHFPLPCGQDNGHGHFISEIANAYESEERLTLRAYPHPAGTRPSRALVSGVETATLRQPADLRRCPETISVRLRGSARLVNPYFR
jgi:hypothetical protein